MNSISPRPISGPIMQKVLNRVQSGQARSLFEPPKIPLDQCSAFFRTFYEASPSSLQKCLDAIYGFFEKFDIRGEAELIFSDPKNVHTLLIGIQTGNRAYIACPDAGEVVFRFTPEDDGSTLKIVFLNGFIEHDVGTTRMKLDGPFDQLREECARAIDSLKLGPGGTETEMRPFT